jgi:Major Facilitator Superfamily
MLTIGGAVFCLTFALVKGNDRGWGSSLIVLLLVASALLTVCFALSQRYGRYPMLTRALVRNRQFMGASTSLLLFGTAMMGTLFITVIAFVNLWGYSELEAAFAITPVPLMAMLVSPIVGRLSSRLQPRAFGVPALILMATGLLALSGLPAEPSIWRAVWPLALVGLGVGATFPAVSIGSMGSIRGQEVGLGSGIVNMSRQVGFAVGVALLVAVFTGTIDDELRSAEREVMKLEQAQMNGSYTLLFAFKSDDPTVSLPKDTPPEVRHIVDEHLRDSYGAAIRTAAFVTLLAIPFSLTMRRRPGEVATPEMAAAVATAG